MADDPPPFPHDALFRAAFADPARAAELLRCVLPADVAAAIDWTSLRRIDASFVDPWLRPRAADLLFVARLGEREVLLYLLLEHKSESDPWTAFQLLGYVVRIWQQFRRERPDAERLPPVLPFVICHGTGPWRGPRTLRDLVDLEGAPAALRDLQPQFTFWLDDLTAEATGDLSQRRLTAATLLPLLHLQQLRRDADTAALLLRWRQLHLELLATPGGQDLLDQLISFVVAVSEAATDDLRRAYRSIHVTTEQTYMTVAQKLIAQGLLHGRQEGRLEGRQEGRLEGRLEGRAELLVTLLQQRFGALPDDLPERVRSAAPADLERWAARLFSATTLDAVFAP